MSPIRYLGRIWHFAFARFVIRTDAMQIIAASAVPLGAELTGAFDPSAMGPPVLSWIGYAAISLIVLRLLLAPYYVWKEEYDRANALQEEVDNPVLLERREFARLRAEKRMQLIPQIRAIQFAAIHEKPEAFFAASREFAQIQPMVMPDVGVHKEIAAYLMHAGEMANGLNQDTKKEDAEAKLRDLSEALIQKIHKI